MTARSWIPAPTVWSRLLLAAAMFVPATALAQEPRFRLGMIAGIATVDSEAPFAAAGSVAYRFAPGLWFETELTWIDGGSFDSGYLATPVPLPTPDRPLPGASSDGFIPSGESTPVATITERPTFVGTLGIRWELVESDRFRPYVAGAMGLNHTVERLRTAGDPGTILSEVEVTGAAFTAGAGGSVRLARQLWAEVDARYLRLSGDRNSMRVGGGVSLRF